MAPTVSPLSFACSKKSPASSTHCLVSTLFKQDTPSYSHASFKTDERVKYTLVQALRLCTGRTTHRGSRGIAVLYRHWGSAQAVRPIGGVEV